MSQKILSYFLIHFLASCVFIISLSPSFSSPRQHFYRYHIAVTTTTITALKLFFQSKPTVNSYIIYNSCQIRYLNQFLAPSQLLPPLRLHHRHYLRRHHNHHLNHYQHYNCYYHQHHPCISTFKSTTTNIIITFTATPPPPSPPPPPLHNHFHHQHHRHLKHHHHHHHHRFHELTWPLSRSSSLMSPALPDGVY